MTCRIIAAVLMLAAESCSGEAEKKVDPAPVRVAPGAGREAATGARLTTLTGLYEGGSTTQPDQMCIVESDGAARFGLVVWGSNQHSCSGTGIVTRDGGALRLAMSGDEACTITASVAGTTVTLPGQLPAGCGYYCGARARLENASFTQKGATREIALRAKDLVGDPLCAGAA